MLDLRIFKLYIFCFLLSLSFCLISSAIRRKESPEPASLTSPLSGIYRLPTDEERVKYPFDRKVPLPERIKTLVQRRLQERKHLNKTERGTYSLDNIKITFDPDYEIDNETEEVFIWAAETLSILIDITVPIKIFVSWEPMGNSVIGSAGPTSLYKLRDYFYPVALYNQLVGDRVQSGYDISATFNSQFDFYLGTDGKTPSSQIDLASVVLHEFCHGLGFTSAATWTAFGATYSVDHYIVDEFLYLGKSGSGGLVYDSVDLDSSFTSNNIYYIDNVDLPTTVGKMYSPPSWESGSSLSHLDESTYYDTDDTLMTPSIAKGEYIHFIGPIVNQVFTSMGWVMRDCSIYSTESECYEYCCHYCPADGTCGDPELYDVKCSDSWSAPPNCSGGDGRSDTLSKCEQQTSCSSCTSYLECSWCPGKETCVDAAVIAWDDCSDWKWGQCSIPGWVVLILLGVLGLLVLSFLIFIIRSCCCYSARTDYDLVN